MFQQTYEEMNKKLTPDPVLVAETLQKMEEAGSKGRRRRSRGRAWKTAVVSAAAAFVTLFAANAAFPAFAEELPVLGEIFKRLNSIGSNAFTYDGLVEGVDVSGNAGRYQLNVSEAYSDGKFLLFTLKLDSDDPEVLQMAYLQPSGAWEGGQSASTVTVNGERADMRKGIHFEKRSDYETVCYAALPREYQNGDRLHVELGLDGLSGCTQEDLDNAGTERPSLSLDEAVSLGFDVTVNTGYNQAAAAAVTDEGVTLDSWEISPTVFTAQFSYPYPGSLPGVFATAVTDSGEALPEEYAYNDFLKEPRFDKDFGDTVTTPFQFGAPAEGAKKIVLTLYNCPADRTFYDNWVDGGKMGRGVFGQFTIDLEAKTATPTEAYRAEGYERIDITEYAAALEAGPVYQNHIFVPAVSGISPGTGLVYGDPDDPKNGAFQLRFSFRCDTAEKLPLEARFSLDGRVFAAAPLCTAGDPVDEGFAGSLETRVKLGDAYDSRRTELSGDLGYLYKNAKYEYAIDAYCFEEYPQSAGAAEDFWSAHKGRVELINTETGQVLYDSSEKVPVHCPF